MNDIWDNVKKVVANIAPVLANAIVPGSGGLAASLVSKALGVRNDPKEIEQALVKATPEQIEKLKQLELQHEEKLIELATENDKLYLKDRQNARNREIEIVKATGHSDWNLYLLAWTVVVGFFVLCWVLMNFPLPQGSSQVVFMLFGALSTGFGTVLSYFFGSSKSSAEKTKLLKGGRNIDSKN